MIFCEVRLPIPSTGPAHRELTCFDRPGDFADGKRHLRFSVPDVIHADETFGELLFDIVRETDQNGFGLALGLLVIEICNVAISRRRLRSATSSLNNGRTRLEADLVGQHEQPIAFLLIILP